MSEHFQVVCKHCKTTISQCRCPGPHKTVRFSVCVACAAGGPPVETIVKPHDENIIADAVVMVTRPSMMEILDENASLRARVQELLDRANKDTLEIRILKSALKGLADDYSSQIGDHSDPEVVIQSRVNKARLEWTR